MGDVIYDSEGNAVGPKNPLPVSVKNAVGYDSADDAMRISSIQGKMRDNFPYGLLGGYQSPLNDNQILGNMDGSKWDIQLGAAITEPGGAVGAAFPAGAVGKVAGANMFVDADQAGSIIINLGTTANAQLALLCKRLITIPHRAMIALQFSQRIANQEFFVELVSVDPSGLPDGRNYIGWLFSGTNINAGSYEAMAQGLTKSSTSFTQFSTTTGALSIYELEPFTDEVWFHQRSALDGTAGRSQSFAYQSNSPDPEAIYKFRIRAKNGAVAPASNTTVTIKFLAIQDYQEITAEVTAGRSIAAYVSGTSLPVNLVTQPSVIPAVSSAANNLTNSKVISAASSTNPTSLKTSAGRIYRITVSNTTASWRYLKIFSKSSAPTVGTDVPVTTIGIPPGTTISPLGDDFGIYLASGIAIAITAGSADNDSGQTAAGDVVADIFWY